MGFDPGKYKAPEAKKLPVILLLDVSGSMSVEGKIDKLYDATVDMINDFVDAVAKEQQIDIAIITFGASVELHTAYTPVQELQKRGLSQFRAYGMTPMGVALKMAKDMIEDKNVTPSRIYKPAVILVSDGAPTDDWEEPLDEFINCGRSQKCQRFAVAIGNGANIDVLRRFTGDPDTVLLAENAKDISDKFKMITMSVSTRIVSQKKNSVPTPSTTVNYDNNSDNDSDDEDSLY